MRQCVQPNLIVESLFQERLRRLFLVPQVRQLLCPPRRVDGALLHLAPLDEVELVARGEHLRSLVPARLPQLL